MPNRIFCEACGAPLPGAGAVCTVCGAGTTPAYGWAGYGAGRQDQFGAAPKEHSTTRAAVLGMVPGLGHLYAGHRLKAVAIFSGFVAALFVGTDLDMTMIGATVGIPIDAGGLGLWLFSMWDAYWTVRQDNRVVQAAASSTPALR
ncbi:MAG: hypothetical protein J2P38_07535 [Candidatus Dormibacteraeota bacterium]|nr:hypothetical protein [Candidatus Dormibacteraeota bacterium]